MLVAPTSPSSSRTRPPPPATPRRRKSLTRPPIPFVSGPNPRRQGLRTLPANLSLDAIRTRLKALLKLTYEPDEWQIQLISHIFQRYDSIALAGTGYGKSLIFQALAALALKGKLTVIICPLKALECDQAKQCVALGLDAIVINEDTVKDDAAQLWKRARTSAQLVYMSPEMALSESFGALWKDSRFRARLTAIIVDEAHCIDDWGDDKFRPLYRKLSGLRAFTGQEVPVVACTATCSTSTFDAIWSTLGYGNRPFWGIDVGCDRTNLFFMVRPLVHAKTPLLEVLNFLPDVLDDSTSVTSIRKGIIYLDSVAGCQALKNELRKCLPPHLRSSVYAFSSMPSTRAKEMVWTGFQGNLIRILVATDAAGMGCNIPDISYSVVFGSGKTFSSVAQRWGRAGRDRTTEGTCVLLVPPWAIPPEQPAQARSILALRGASNKESKADVAKRERLDKPLAKFLELRNSSHCRHNYLRTSFSPVTSLTTYDSYTRTIPVGSGSRAASSPYEMHWVVPPPDAKRFPAHSRCCDQCNPEIASKQQVATTDDTRLHQFSADFLYPPVQLPSRPSSVLSTAASDISVASQISTGSHYRDHTIHTKHTPAPPAESRYRAHTFQDSYKVPDAEQERLQADLESVRHGIWVARGSSAFLSPQVYLPPKQLKALTRACDIFLRQRQTSVKSVLAVCKLDFATTLELQSIADAITFWRESVPLPPVTPPSQRRMSKRPRTIADVTNTPTQRIPMPQPNFTSAKGTPGPSSGRLTARTPQSDIPSLARNVPAAKTLTQTPLASSSLAGNPYAYLATPTPKPRRPASSTGIPQPILTPAQIQPLASSSINSRPYYRTSVAYPRQPTK